jgi:hypothetical protein
LTTAYSHSLPITSFHSSGSEFVSSIRITGDG